jgi:hypothetical protein
MKRIRKSGVHDLNPYYLQHTAFDNSQEVEQECKDLVEFDPSFKID